MQTHYLNADFDLSLCRRPRRLAATRLERRAAELSLQGMIGAQSGDAVLVHALPDEPFLEHLGACGLAVPRLLLHPEIDPESGLRPFGWNAEAIELNGKHRQPVQHPSLAVVRKVNARSFGHRLERRLEGGEPRGEIIHEPAELEAFLSRAPAAGGWLLKAEHSHSGLGNRRLATPRLSPTDRKFVASRLAEDACLVVEPWLERVQDWCAVFEVPFAPETFRVHESVCSRDGVLVGAWFEPTNRAPELAGVARQIADALSTEGYFGPVCLDAFTWRDGQRERLRPLVDLNCRRAMSDGAYRLACQHVPDRTVFYRFYRRATLSLPDRLHEASAALGERGFDPSRRDGILMASPFALDDRSASLLAVLFVAADRAGARELESWFRESFVG